MANLNIDAAELEPVIERAIERVLARMEESRQLLGDKLCYTEAEAAAILDVNPHVLRDERLRHRIRASKIVGRRIRYTRADLVDYLASRPAASD
jgi:hypothetical protein